MWIKFICIILILLNVGCINSKNHKQSSHLSSNNKPKNDHNYQLQDLSDQIVSNLTNSTIAKIAVLDFQNLQGQVTNLGRYISEELITRIFTSGKFAVIERRLLTKILEEHKLSSTGLLDKSNLVKLGKVAGVGAIVSGTITDLSDFIRINARLINTQTGELLAVSSVNLSKTQSVLNLLGESSNESEGYIFYDDFSDAEIFNRNWPSGGESLFIKESFNSNFLYDHSTKESHRIHSKMLTLPDIYELKFSFKFGLEKYKQKFTCHLGHIKIEIPTYFRYSLSCWKFKQKFKIKGNLANQVVNVVLKKNNSEHKLFINGENVINIDYSPLTKKTNLALEFSNMKNFAFYNISISEMVL